MEIASLRTLSTALGLNQSDLARAAGVSRQAVSRWFVLGARGEPLAIRSDHLAALSRSTRVSPRELLEPLPGLSTEERARWRAELLWDNLFPDLDAFVVAVADGDERALARLVDRLGLFKAAKIAGKGVWKRFPSLKRHLRPQRARELECLWTLQRNLGLI